MLLQVSHLLCGGVNLSTTKISSYDADIALAAKKVDEGQPSVNNPGVETKIEQLEGGDAFLDKMQEDKLPEIGKRRVKRALLSARDILGYEEDDDEGGEGDALDGFDSLASGSKGDKNSKEHKGPKVWDHWAKWSACSVTCGIGKITRWRHCVSGGCATGEKEAQIKTCTFPAC